MPQQEQGAERAAPIREIAERERLRAQAERERARELCRRARRLLTAASQLEHELAASHSLRERRTATTIFLEGVEPIGRRARELEALEARLQDLLDRCR